MEVFENAGKKPGLQVWRVEQMELKEMPKDKHGVFYMGDSYIVLDTTPTSCYSVHAWQGRDATQDERGAAAIFMTQLDDHLDGQPVQYTEYQRDESSTFKSYFRRGIKYMKGGVASGFKDVTTNEVNVKRLFHVKGRRPACATEVDFSWDSFNSGDCFIIDLGKDIYNWWGSKSNRCERRKTTLMANDIRDNERSGRAEVHIVEEGDEAEQVLIDVLGPKPDLPSEDPDDEVQQESRRDRSGASLYMISDAEGSMKATLVAEKNPFQQSSLLSSECFLLANKSTNTIYVWKGREAKKCERKAAMKAARQFIQHYNMCNKTKIRVIPENAESTCFKECFCDWLDKDETTTPGATYTIGKIAKVKKIPFDASSLHEDKAMAAQHCMVDDGSGEVKIWRVEEGDKVPVDESTYGQFFGGDCYLVQYTYNDDGRQKYIIYFWQGNNCSQDELGASALLAAHMDNDCLGGVATQVRVTQGKEPPHLVAMFKNHMIVHLGGTSRDGGQTCPAETRLFHIRISSTKATRAVEVEPNASALNSNDVFILKTAEGVTLWKGKGAVEEEMEAAKTVVDKLFKNSAVQEVEEGEEPDSFWTDLGGKAAYQTSTSLRSSKNINPPRLFACANKTGNLIAEEVPGDLQQEDLATDDVMILDSGEQIFVWVGKDACATEREGAKTIAEDYLKTDPSGRCGVTVATFHQGNEPRSFTGWFQAWDPNLWDK